MVFELFIPDCHTLKQKRAVVRPIVEGCTAGFRVAAAEVGHLDKWQRADIAVAVVSGTEATSSTCSTRSSGSCGRSPRSRCSPSAARGWRRS